MGYFAYDDQRSFIELAGKDGKSLLQGIITNDVELVSPTNSIYTALLSPQGKYLFDFFIHKTTDGLMIDVHAERQADLFSLLKKYKLRSDVEIKAIEADSMVYCAYGADVFQTFQIQSVPGSTKVGPGYTVYVDPRLSEMGLRIVTNDETILNGLERVKYTDYDCHRLSLGIPEGSADMLVDKAIPLECGLDELNAISWNKGCYLGQELTARTKHRGLVRKRLLPVTFDGGHLQEMTPVFFHDQEVGTMRSSVQGYGIALIRLESLELYGPDDYMIAGGEKIKVHVMPWMSFQQ